MDKISGAYSRTNSYEQVTAPSSISDEFYYRFMPPDANNLYGLAPGETYTLSGSVSHTAGELKFRSQYSTNGSSWVDLSAPSDLGIPVSDGSAFTSFSHTFTVPVGATGIYISLQNYDYTAGSLFRFKNMKLEKGSVATNWCLSQSELTTTTGSYRGVTLNDRGLTATAGSTTVAMNSNAGFLINNLKDASADNPGGQVFHVDTDGNLTISGSLTSSATISGVNFTGQNLTLSGSLKLTGDNSAISSNNGDVVFNKNGIIATSGPTTVTINGTDPLRIQSNNNDIFKVDNKGSLTISGNLTTGDSPNSTISGVNFTGESLTLSGSMKVKGQILFANNSGVLSSQGLSLKGGGLSISDSQGNQTTYIKPDGTFTTNKGFFSGTITGSNIILNANDGSVINANGGTFMVDSAGNVTAKSITITGNRNANVNNLAALNGVSIYNGSVIEGSIINGGTINGATIKAGDTTDFFQTSKDNIYWITDNGYQSAVLGKGTYTNFPGFNIFDSQAISLGTYAGSYVQNGTIEDNGGSIGHPQFNIERPADSAFNLFSETGERTAPLDNARISGWVGPKEFFSLEQTQGFHAELNPDLNTSQFTIQKDGCIGAYFGQGNNGNQITFATAGNGAVINVNSPLNVYSSLNVTGAKHSIVKTSQGYVGINAYETAEYYFGDIGEANTGENSQVVIGIDKIFNETINTTVPYQVFITPYSNCHVWVDQRFGNRFVIKSDKPNAQFGWELKAKRKGYENYRLRHVDGIKEKGEFKV